MTTRLTTILQKAWLHRGPLAVLLLPLAVIYWLLFTARRTAYRINWFKTTSFPVPVIVVGNVVVGGAGKTPLVMALVKHFQQQGLKVGVVSRGYGRHTDEPMEVLTELPASQVGDEPALIKTTTGAPVFVARQRVDATRLLLKKYPLTDLVICDDGLQHEALHRDVAISVFDDRGIGNGWLLPAGLLREPWPQRTGKRVDFVLHTGSAPKFAGYVSNRHLADYAVDAEGRQVALATFVGQPVTALAAIASPAAFFEMLQAYGLRLDRTIALPDHFSFAAGLADIEPALDKNHIVLCTQKDAVKLFSQGKALHPCLLAVPLVFDAETAFYTALDTLLTPLIRRDHSQVPSRDGH